MTIPHYYGSIVNGENRTKVPNIKGRYDALTQGVEYV